MSDELRALVGDFLEAHRVRKATPRSKPAAPAPTPASSSGRPGRYTRAELIAASEVPPTPRQLADRAEREAFEALVAFTGKSGRDVHLALFGKGSTTTVDEAVERLGGHT